MEKTVALIKQEKLSKVEKMFLYFILYAVIGWCLETFYGFMALGHFVERGFLYGPLCPIYGFGAILLIFNVKDIKQNKWIQFLIAMIVFSVFEYVASFALEAIFQQRWWDYSNNFLNIEGRVCLVFSIVWGIAGVLFVNKIHPWIEKRVKKVLCKIPYSVQKITIMILLFLILLDTMFFSNETYRNLILYYKKSM